MSEVIVFTSGKGGVGKSNLCLNTALELTAQQYRTCLFDGDLGLANVNILLGIEQEHTLDDVVFRNKSLDEILIQTGYGFDIIPGSSGAEQIANLSGAQLESLITALAGVGEYDYFLIDTASGISRGVISFCLAARETIIVITHEATSLTDAYALLKILSINGYMGSVRILINNCETIPQAKQTYVRYKKVVDKHLDIEIAPAGIILHDDHFERAVAQQKPLLELYPESVGAQCIRAFVSNLIRDNAQGEEPETLSTFWQRYLELVIEEEPPPTISDSPAVRRDTGAAEQEPVPIRSQIPIGSLSKKLDYLALDSSRYAGQLNCSSVLLSSLFRSICQGDISVSQLRQMISIDPVLMVQALQLTMTEEAGSHVYDLGQLLDALRDDQIQPMLLQTAISSVGAKIGKSADDYAAEQVQLQRSINSYTRAILAKEFALATSAAVPDEAYICGLLCDIGLFSSEDNQTAGDATENHAAFGAELLQSLGMNSMMCDAVRFHHHQLDQIRTAFDLVRIVFTANALVHENDLEQQDPEDVYRELIGISRDQAMELLAKAREEVFRHPAQLDLDVDGSLDKTIDVSGDLSRYLMEHLLTQGLMPPGAPRATLEDWQRRIHWNCRLLFDLRHVICFLADEQAQHLSAIGYPGCFGYDNLANIVIPVDNSTSLLSRAFTTGSLVIGNFADESDTSNLADRQLGRLLGETAMICVPLKSEETTVGLIVCGTGIEEIETIRQRDTQLVGLGARAARDFGVLRDQLPE